MARYWLFMAIMAIKKKGKCRGANQRMNPDFAESAPKVADFADFWPIFPADEV